MSRSPRRVEAKALSKQSASARAAVPLPQFAAPQLATLARVPPAGEGWAHEIKYDGYRIMAAVAGDRCRLYTRSGQDWTDKFAPVAAALCRMRLAGALLDGEIVALDEKGLSSFGRLQRSIKQGSAPLTYFVFDILELDGRDLRLEPLRERKRVLRRLLSDAPDSIRFSEDIAGQGPAVLAEACRIGLEGIVSKELDKPYVSRRSSSWLKTKCSGNEEFVIGGYRLSDKQGRPFSSLLLGEFADGKLHYRGRVGTGFDTQDLDSLAARFARLARKTSPFADIPRAIARDARWVEPKLVAQIAFTERTSDGLLRHPAFLGLREDKPAKEVSMQLPQTPKRKTEKAGATRAKERKPATPVSHASRNGDLALGGVALSSPEKVLFPEAGITKLQLAEYFQAVSQRMLPHVEQRPLSIVRCPEGAEGACFYQKHAKKGMPEALKSVSVREADGKPAQYLMLDDARSLVALAQIGALEVHPWGARAATLEHPDRLIFDLDPDPSVPFAAVRAAAADLRGLLDTAGLTTFALVTGGKGVHVIAPLDARQDWPTIKSFARGVAEKLAANEPERFVATMSKAKRRGRIFIDWLRNERGATAIAPYSPRARANASVATPVTWPELARLERADAFTMPMIMQRVRRKGDAWSGYFAARQSIGRKALDFFA